MNEEQIQPTTQPVWLTKTTSLTERPHKSLFTIANGVVSITTNGTPIFTAQLAGLQVNTNGTSGMVLVKNEQGELVRLMFVSPIKRLLAMSPLIVVLVGALIIDAPFLAGISLAALLVYVIVIKKVEALSVARKQFLSSLSSAGVALDAPLRDTQAKESYSLGRKIALGLTVPLLTAVWAALAYVIVFAILAGMGWISADSALAPKIVIFLALFALLFKPTYALIAKVSDWIARGIHLQP